MNIAYPDLFIVFYVAVMWTGLLDEDAEGAGGAARGFARFLAGLGLRQPWRLFAPDPLKSDFYLTAKIKLRNGETHLWSGPRFDLQPLHRSFLTPRHISLIQSLVIRNSAEKWEQFARYLSKKHGDRGNPAVKVTIFVFYKILPAPKQVCPAREYETRRYRRAVAYRCELSEEARG